MAPQSLQLGPDSEISIKFSNPTHHHHKKDDQSKEDSDETGQYDEKSSMEYYDKLLSSMGKLLF